MAASIDTRMGTRMSAPDLIVAAGTALYGDGDGWQSELARAIGVSSRTVRHWIRGDYKPRPGVWRDIERLMVGKIDRVERIVGDVRAAANPTAHDD